MNMNTAFQRILILGYGKVTGEVLQYVYGRREEYGYRMEFIEHEIHPFSITEQICPPHNSSFSFTLSIFPLALMGIFSSETTLPGSIYSGTSPEILSFI